VSQPFSGNRSVPEQLTLNQRVAGSSPAAPTINQWLTRRSRKSPNNYPHSVRKIGAAPTAIIRVLQDILDRIEPPPVREPLPPLRHYEPPRVDRRRRGRDPPGGWANSANWRFSPSQREMIAHQKATVGLSTGTRGQLKGDVPVGGTVAAPPTHLRSNPGRGRDRQEPRPSRASTAASRHRWRP
jgi:hypothetical protein